MLLPASAVLLPASIARGQAAADEDKFRQLEELLPTPNASRSGAGAPGPGYWQQRCDYEIDVRLDDARQSIEGSERITYTNNSPHHLNYLWLQLDPNLFARNSDASLTATAPSLEGRLELEMLRGLLAREQFDGAIQITAVQDAARRDLAHTIVKTMMRVELPATLRPGETFEFHVHWNYRLNDARLLRGRTGYEFFEKDGNYIYEIAQWYPRLAAFTDVTGWQHKQYLGAGEFTLELGNFVVRLTVPDDHVVAATGTLLNAGQVLTAEQQQRLQQALQADKPVFIVTPAEAQANEAHKPQGTRTWIFKADNVRDFAFATSRKFIWDAQGHAVGGNRVLAMSFYPKEAEPLWSKYSTHAIVHTLNVYSRYTFDYPYPVAISVNGPVYGMEYPMICFNGPRPEEDGTYSKRTKYALISVVIHEVGHNYFPMIVNSDERQWTWMDEGLNTFLQYLAEQEWEDKYPSQRGEPRDIVGYMRSTSQVPIMTNSESILQFGNNAYAKPATALNILRETILGRELFDYAFREYARRWQFKRPMPADFFRTMEDASGVDLDWFWRGWFYTTDHTDIAIRGVRLFQAETGNPDVDKTRRREERDARPPTLAQQRNAELPKRAAAFPELKDFYNDFDELQVTDADRKAYQKFLERLDEREKQLLESKQNFYVVDFDNLGGLVMPILLRIDYTDGSSDELRIPAEIWRRNSRQVSKLIITAKELKSLTLDPHGETADVDPANNHFPPQVVKSRFQLFKQQRERNEMQQQQGQEAKP
ncbi:MAG: M1 family metallopeptidase [Pirellulaceae bacterium]|nr:M1 family metallopeptidase [Pirellulaceae bacterium]